MSIERQDFDRFMNEARVKLPGASDTGIKLELFQVLGEFFHDSSAWTQNINVNILPNVVDYDLVPDEGRIIRLAGVVDANNTPQGALMPSFGTLSIEFPQQTPQVWTATVVLDVDLPTTRDAIPIAPYWVLQVYSRTIMDGLLGKMMGQLAKSYSNTNLSTYHLRRFRDGIAMARTANLRRNTIGSQAWGFPQSYRSRGQRGGVSVGNSVRF